MFPPFLSHLEKGCIFYIYMALVCVCVCVYIVIHFVWYMFTNLAEDSAALMMEGPCFFDTSLSVYQITEDCRLYVQAIASNETIHSVTGLSVFSRYVSNYARG